MPMSASSARTCETIAIGSELLVGGRADSNSLFITEALAAVGVEVRFKSICGDDEGEIGHVLNIARQRAGVVIMTGGLGPAVDDCTGRPLQRRPGPALLVARSVRGDEGSIGSVGEGAESVSCDKR